MSVPRRSVASVALINPIGDYGIDTYTYELGQGLAANGVRVDAYCAAVSHLRALDLDPNHRRFNVLGRRLPRDLSGSAAEAAPPPGMLPVSVAAPPQRVSTRWKHALRRAYLATELALRLKREKYDVVWTQWPEMDDYSSFWNAARKLGLNVVHTVHNIFPHERRPDDVALYSEVYETARLLFVHSGQVRDELVSLFPGQASKVVAVPHGTYTFYRRCPAIRASVRERLRIPANAVVLLFCGAIRPYKNLDAALAAFAALRDENVVMIISGWERDATSDNPLAQTTELVRRTGIENRVRMVPGALPKEELAELFEASDILLLPYLKSYGSGLLMLGITFGKYIVATRSGMEESASRYPRSIVLNGDDARAIERGIEAAVSLARVNPLPLNAVLPEFQWANIAATSLIAIERTLSRA
jgi:glycosyltransferase involved in cell wall biosynthesis